MTELIVVGAGPGVPEQMTAAAKEAVREAGCVVAAPRLLPLAEGHSCVLTLKDFEAAFRQMEAQKGSVAVLVAGDPGIFSLLPALKRRFPEAPLRVYPGISSLQYLCAEAGEVWQDAAILSGHGRPLGEARFLNVVERNRLTALFCDNRHSPGWACKALAGACGGLGERVEAVVGERLGYPDGGVLRGLASTLAGFDGDFDPLSVMLVRNPAPWTPPGRLGDSDFERDPRVPMTREEVRAVILGKLKLAPDSVFWDIGAGTGSVSAAAGLECGEVHAVERGRAALALLERNRARFRLHHMAVHPGRASAVMEGLPNPTHVFVGGSGGELKEILSRLKARETPLRVVVSAVTLETLSAAASVMEGWPGFEAVQVSVAASRPLSGGGLLMAGQNPVTLLCAAIHHG